MIFLSKHRQAWYVHHGYFSLNSTLRFAKMRFATRSAVWTLRLCTSNAVGVIQLAMRDFGSETRPFFCFCFFSTNLHSFVSFGKTHKLHNAIDHWLAGVARQAHVALDAITEEERAVHTGHGGHREDKGVENSSKVLG